MATLLKNRFVKLILPYFFLTCLSLGILLIQLTTIPVFADEAIYIRWAQLIDTDLPQYLFYPLNDGKTPLFMWLLVPFLKVISDPLVAGRTLAAVIGTLTVSTIYSIAKILKPTSKYPLLAGVMTTVTPFAVFHHRLALIDGLVILWTSLIILITVHLSKQLEQLQSKKLFTVFSNRYVLFLSLSIAVCLALALLTKLTALLILPSIWLSLFVSQSINKNSFIRNTAILALITIVAIVSFFTLSLHPAFPQLFSRGSDFLYPLSELTIQKIPEIIARNSRFVFSILWTYFSPVTILLLLLGTIIKKNKSGIILFLAGLASILPLILLAKVLHSRYFFSIFPFLILSMWLAVERLSDLLQTVASKQPHLPRMLLYSIIIVPMLWLSSQMIFTPEKATYIKDDQAQYFTEWSSGHGITEVVKLLQDNSQTTSIALATEGYFGTLPDAILMYLYKKDVNNLYIEGIGQPVNEIKGKYITQASNYDYQWLVVNNFRMNINLPKEHLIAEYCRPQLPSACLQVWDITQYLIKD